MPQNPYAVYPAVNNGIPFPLNVTANKYLLVSSNSSATYNITTPTVVKASAGQIGKVSVIIAGSAVGTLNDTATTGSVAVSNQIMTIPNTVGVYTLEWTTSNGIVVVPGTGQTVSISFG